MVAEPRYSSNGRIIKPHDEKTFAKDWQKEILLEHFEKSPYPTKEECLELEKKIELDWKWIRNWFKYVRRRRNITQDRFSSTTKPSQQLTKEGETEIQPEDTVSPKRSIKNKVVSQPWQREILSDYFSRSPYPTKGEVAEIEAKIKLDSVWIKTWFHDKRQKEKNNPTSNFVMKKPAGEKVTLSEDTGTDESFEKVIEAPAAAPAIKSEMFEELRSRFEELQTQYNVLSELLLQRVVTTEQTRDVEPPKVPTVDLTGSSSDPPPPEVRQYPGVGYPGPGYTFPHYYPHYYPPQYPAYPPPPPSYYPQPTHQPQPPSLPYPPLPQ